MLYEELGSSQVCIFVKITAVYLKEVKYCGRKELGLQKHRVANGVPRNSFDRKFMSIGNWSAIFPPSSYCLEISIMPFF